MATIERRERKNGVVYLADIRIQGFPRQKKTFKRLTDPSNGHNKPRRLFAQESLKTY